jgi:hypothetical protein
MTRRMGLAALIVGGSLSLAGRAGADAVTFWNEVAVQAVSASRPGGPGFLDQALVQAAVYDAVQSIEGRFEPYFVHIPNASGSSSVAAARAAHDLLVSLYASNVALVASLDASYASYLAANGLSPLDPGAAVGAAVAASYLPLYRAAGIPASSPGGTGAGVWRPTPPANAPGFAPWLATVTPFTLESPSQFRADSPPLLISGAYRHDYDEVKALGSATGSARTPEQTAVAAFYNENYLGLLNRAVSRIADAHLDDIADTARLLALTNLAGADAVITAWDSKFHYNYWRPITAIREGDSDGNPKTVGDPTWTPFAITPPYPDYTSGANNVTAATMETLRLFFGTDRFTFSMTSAAVNQTRVYTRFSDVEQDVVDARVYEGIHFRSADERARKQGEKVARWAFTRFLRPVKD